MKKIFLCIMTFVCMMSNAAEEKFLAANKLYENHEYEKALSLYRHISDKGAVVWYNMGNCAYNLALYDQAYLYWKKADWCASQAELQESIAHNLVLVEKKRVPLNTQDPFLPLKRYGRRIPGLVVQLFFLVSLVMLWVIWRRKKMRSDCFVMVSFFVGAFLYVTHHRQDQSFKSALVNKKSIVYAGPDVRYHSVTSLEPNTELEVAEVRDRWGKVHYGKTVGWVLLESLTVV